MTAAGQVRSEIVSRLKAAGLDELKADVQAQYDEWRTTSAREAGAWSPSARSRRSWRTRD